MTTLTIYKPGTRVKCNDRIEGTITSIQIQSCSRVLYEIAIWDGSTRTVYWLTDNEFAPVTNSHYDRHILGFHALHNPD